jgi:hypothetical protein
MFNVLKYYLIGVFMILVLIAPSYAITPIPTSYVQIAMPSINCGDATASDPQIRKCCKVIINTPEIITAQFRQNVPVFGKALADLMAPVINKQYSVMKFTSSQKEDNQACANGVPSTPGDVNNDNCICILSPTGTPLDAMKPICGRMDTKSNEKNQCEACVGNGGYWSSLGCFSGNVSEFITQKILGTGVGIAGGISMLCIMFAAFQMQTSSGNAEKIKKAQELLTNCITGLMVIIFSILILKIIGVDILKLPGFRL